MGTRHLTLVIKDGKNVVAQYGQWDGYPEGQGLDILSFISGEGNIDKLKANLNKVRFLDFVGRDKEFIDSYNKNAPEWSNEPDNRTQEQKDWADRFMSRDIGGKILSQIANYDGDEILLKDDTDFATDGLFCEGIFTINLDKNTYEVNGNVEFDLDNLPDKDDFLATFVEVKNIKGD